jgi:3-oxoacyl-[acyl-carrier protein] reductase
MARLSGKTALVTGGSRGIGRAIATRLAADGALVAVHYSSSLRAARETVSAIQAAGGRAFSVRAELGVDGDIDLLFDGLDDGLSGQPLDILVNNAAVLAGGPIEHTTPTEFDRIFAVNVRAPFFIIQRALTLLHDGGRIINVSSSTTRIASGLSAYAMTKNALNALSHDLAQRLGQRGITINTVVPGVTETDSLAPALDDPAARGLIEAHTALRRIGKPADVADVVAFLASDDARWITGQLLDATGGLMLGPPAADAS